MLQKNKLFVLNAVLCLMSLPLQAQQNYVRTYTPKQDLSPTATLTYSNCFHETSYYDTAGRRLQTVRHRINPNGKDMADYVVYDSLGRKSREWAAIPFSSNDGTFKPLSEFEGSEYSGYYHVDYGYEASTLNRLTSETGRNTAGHSIMTEYVFSDGGTPVHRFSVNGTTVTNNGTFANNSLQGTKVTDEDGSVLYTFKDPQGKVLLERRTSIYGEDPLDTYYIYDNWDLLVCVLPPAAAAALGSVGSYTLSSGNVLDKYAYFYKYDERLNCAQKKLPGAGWWYYVYDGDDRPVLSQSPNQREEDLWSFTKYDKLGREVVKGIMSISGISQELIQMVYIDLLVCEQYTGAGGPLLGYTDHNTLGTVENVLEVNYFDNYRFSTHQLFGTLAPLQSPNAINAADKGNLTGHYVALTDGTEGEITRNTYDRRGRLSKTEAYSYPTECLRMETFYYNHPGLVTGSRAEWHLSNGTSLQDSIRYVFDAAFRLKSGSSRVSYTTAGGTLNRNATLFSDYFDDFCRQRLHYGYNYRGMTTYTYRLDGKLQNSTNKYLTETLHYDEPNQYGMQYFNGRISAIDIQQMGQEYSMHMLYDAFGRLTDAMTPGLGYKESFGYDTMGNITHMMRETPGREYCMTEFLYDGNHLLSSSNYTNSNLGVGNGLDYAAHSENNAYLYDANGNETRNMSQNMASAIYNDLNLPYHVYMQSGNGMGFRYLADGRRIETSSSTVGTPLILPPPPPPGSPAPPPVEYLFTDTEMSFGPLTWRNGILTRYDFPGGFFSLYDDENEQPQLHPYAYITDHLGSVRLTVDGNGSNSGTENARQGMEYLPSGAVFRSTNYDFQTRRFCGKELLTMHGWNMYDSQARFQYSLLPRFSTMDPLAEKYYSFSPYNYAGNDWVNYADNNGDSIHIGTAENQFFFKNAISQVFGESAKNFSFTNTGMLVYNGNKKSSDFTKDQKAVFKGMNRLMKSKVTTEIIYGDSPSYIDAQGFLNKVDLAQHSGAASVNVIDNRNSSANYIFVNPDATSEIDVYATTPAYYIQPISSQNVARFVPMSIATNLADRTFHEIGHIIYAGKTQNKVIDYNNRVRRILGLDARPYDENHNRIIR